MHINQTVKYSVSQQGFFYTGLISGNKNSVCYSHTSEVLNGVAWQMADSPYTNTFQNI